MPANLPVNDHHTLDCGCNLDSWVATGHQNGCTGPAIQRVGLRRKAVQALRTATGVSKQQGCSIVDTERFPSLAARAAVTHIVRDDHETFNVNNCGGAHYLATVDVPDHITKTQLVDLLQARVYNGGCTAGFFHVDSDGEPVNGRRRFWVLFDRSDAEADYCVCYTGEGTAWHRCTTHNQLAPGDNAPCDGFKVAPYVEGVTSGTVPLNGWCDFEFDGYDNDGGGHNHTTAAAIEQFQAEVNEGLSVSVGQDELEGMYGTWTADDLNAVDVTVTVVDRLRTSRTTITDHRDWTGKLSGWRVP